MNDPDISLLYDDTAELNLASALLASTARFELPELLERVSPEDFYNPSFGALWTAAKTLTDEGKRVSRRTLMATVEGIAGVERIVNGLAGNYVPVEELARDAGSVVNKAKWRKLVNVLSGARDKVLLSDDYETAYDWAATALLGLSEEGGVPQGPVRLSDASQDWLEWLAEDPENVRVFPTPWDELNEKLAGGLQTKRTYYWGGRPGDGKTLAVVNAASHIAEMGRTVLVCSLEMPTREVVSRVVASSAEVEYGMLTKREVDDFNMNRVALYLNNRVDDSELYIWDALSSTIEQIRSTAKAMKNSEKGLDVLVIDHIGLVKATNRQVGREQQLSHISWMCTLIAKELDIAVVIAAQLNRGPAQDNTPPKPSDLRESGSLEQNADVVILLHHEKVNDTPTGEVTMILGKNRTGPAGVNILLPFRPWRAKIG